MGGETADETLFGTGLTLAELRADGLVLAEWLRHAFFAPGEFACRSLLEYLPQVAGESGLDLARHLELWTLAFSSLVWLVVLFVTWHAFRAVFRAFARLLWYLRELGTRTLRSLRLRLEGPWMSWRRRRAARRFHSTEHRIDPLQMAVLDALRRLPPGHVATAVDIAADLGVRPGLVQPVLDELRKLALVEVSFATSDGYAGYALTKPGEVFCATLGASVRRVPALSRPGAAPGPIRWRRPEAAPVRHSPATASSRRPR